MCRTGRSFRSSKATAPGRTSGASKRVFDAAVEKAYGGKRQIAWQEVLAGQKSFDKSGSWLPDETLDAFRELRVGIKGPLTTPVGGGIRSLNVALRQLLDLFVCLRPVRYFHGVPSPVREPQLVDMVIFRENTEDIYAGIEFAGGTPESQKVLDFLAREFPKEAGKVRFGTKDKNAAWQKQLESIGAPIAICRSRSASASNRSATSAPSGSCTARSATRSRTNARA